MDVIGSSLSCRSTRSFTRSLASLHLLLASLLCLECSVARSSMNWTKWFLITAVATTITGFFFPFHGFTPAIGLGIISLPFLALTIFARYSKRLAGLWRWIFAIGAVICLYFNLFVLVVQLFEKIPALHALAPTQTESPFKLTQLIVLLVSALLAIIAAIRFHPKPRVATS